METGKDVAWRVGNHQSRNVYFQDRFVAVAVGPDDEAAATAGMIVAAMNLAATVDDAFGDMIESARRRVAIRNVGREITPQEARLIGEVWGEPALMAGHPLTCNGGNQHGKTHHGHQVMMRLRDDHLLCLECGRVQPLGDEVMEALQLSVLADHLEQVDHEVRERLTGGELDRRREEVMQRVRDRRAGR